MTDSNDDIQNELDKLKKDSINQLLKDIYHKSLNERLKTFQPPFVDIVNILEQIGKDIFKVIIESKGFISVKQPFFNFYFWPGYTTLEHRRIFIEGAKTGRNGQKRYFTGVGKQYDINNKKQVSFDHKDENVDKYCFYDCPTTHAFDKVLNTRYFNEEYNPKNPENKYYPGSTHFFRLNQTKEDLKGKRYYLPLKIDKEKENYFKVLNVSITQEESSNKPNVFSVFLNKNELHNSGHQLRLSIQELFKDQDSNYDWPFNAFILKDNPEFDEKKVEDLMEIQTYLYSYWIGETLCNGTSFNKVEFEEKRDKLLKEKGYNELIKVLELSADEKKKKDESPQIYFNHWYTIFHESFCPDEDLGSTMLLTNIELPYHFLISIDNWIKDIYNDLKLIESKAKAEYESQRRNINILKHSQGQFINAQIDFIDSLKTITEDQKIILRSQIDFISGYVDIAENFDKLGETRNYYSEINLTEIISQCLSSIIIIVKTPGTLENNIKFIKSPDDFSEKVYPFLNSIKCEIEKKQILINGNKYKVSLLIKELIINCLENVNQGDPWFMLKIKEEGNIKTLIFENNLNSQGLQKDQYNFIKSGSFLEGQFGWRVIFAIINDHGWSFEIPEYDKILENRKFSFEITIL